jgi:hypothetical protein
LQRPFGSYDCCIIAIRSCRAIAALGAPRAVHPRYSITFTMSGLHFAPVAFADCRRGHSPRLDARPVAVLLRRTAASCTCPPDPSVDPALDTAFTGFLALSSGTARIDSASAFCDEPFDRTTIFASIPARARLRAP